MRSWRTAAMVTLLLAASLGCKGRPRASSTAGGAGGSKEPHSGPSVSVLDLTQGLPEQAPTGVFGVASRKRTFDDFLRSVERVRKDKESRGVLVRFGGTTFGMARAEEVGAALEGLRKDKSVFCHGEAYTNQTMMAAARGCTKIFLSPAGGLETIGIAAQVVYMRRLLADELHLSIDMMQVGKFKGAEEPLTRDGPSPEARASLEGVLSDIRTSWLDGIRTGRKKEVGEAAEDGPYSPAKAKERGLIDEIGYFDDAREQAKAQMGAARTELRFGPGNDADKPEELGDLIRSLGGEGGKSAPIALVRATGAITMTASRSVLGGQEGINEKDLGKIIARLEEDESVKAVVMRIDSPGGSALASDLLWHRLMKLRDKKPLVVSVGDMAASGGYYLASTANAIFADSTSIVGSIGVVGGKIGAGTLLEKFGVHAETFPAKVGDPKAAARAAYGSLLTPWDDATRARVLETMTGIYDLFLARVAEGRKIPVEKVAASAEGRIFSGREGKVRALVDEIGGLEHAVAKARELAKLGDDAQVAPVESTPKLLEALGGSEGDGAEAPPLGAVKLPTASDVLKEIAPDLLPFAAALGPLTEGERHLVAVPYALVVR